MEITAAIANSSALSKLLLPRLSQSPIAAVRSDPRATTRAPRALVRRTRTARRRPLDSGDSDDLFYGDGDDGPFGGGGGSGGRGWNFGGDGGANWEEEGNNNLDPAFDFVYEVVLWIALSNCTHFAVKKLGRILEERGKMEPMPAIC